MGLSRTVSEIKGYFSRKSQNFPISLGVFDAPAEGAPLELGTGAWSPKSSEDISVGRIWKDICAYTGFRRCCSYRLKSGQKWKTGCGFRIIHNADGRTHYG